MKRLFLVSTFLAAIPVFVALAPAPAHAAGCGGVIDVTRWGCAPWDNNDKYGRPLRKAQPQRPQPRPPQQPVYGGSAGGAGLVAQGGGNRSGSGLVAQGGGNRSGSGIVSTAGGNRSGSGIVTNAGSNFRR